LQGSGHERSGLKRKQNKRVVNYMLMIKQGLLEFLTSL
jgi:hypothetical protein